jgi:hypothetical protein
MTFGLCFSCNTPVTNPLGNAIGTHFIEQAKKDMER